MIVASAAFYGILPRVFEFVGLSGAAGFLYALQVGGCRPQRGYLGGGALELSPACCQWVLVCLGRLLLARTCLANTPLPLSHSLSHSLTLSHTLSHSSSLYLCCYKRAGQATGWGMLVYGLLVFGMEFLPFGAVNPPEVAEYFTLVRRCRRLCLCCCGAACV